MHIERQSEKERVRGLRGIPEGGGSHGDSVRSGGKKRERERRRRSGIGTRPTRSNRHGGREGKVKRRETKRGRDEMERKRERRTTVVTVVLSLLLLRRRRRSDIVKPGYRARRE